MASTISELRVPAAPEYIVVAKRTAASFGLLAGFDVESIDEIAIAVVQACENAIRMVQAMGTDECGSIKIVFTLDNRQLDIKVHSSCDHVHTQGSVGSDPPYTEPRYIRREMAERRRSVCGTDDVALRLIGLFVDDYGYRVNERTGVVRIQLTKYRSF